MDTKDRFWLYVLFAMLIGMFALVCLSWGHSVNDTIGGYSWQDYACEHKIHDGYDIHHEHGNGIEWHWHKHARKDGGGLLQSYVSKHTGDLNVVHSADAWTSSGCAAEEDDDREDLDDSGNNPSVPPAEVEVVTPEYPVQPVVDTVKPTAPTTPTRPTPVTPAETLDEVKDQEPVIPDEIEDEVLDAEEIEMTDERESYDYDFHGGWNFVTFPVLPNGVETLEDLYPHLYPHLYNDPILAVYA